MSYPAGKDSTAPPGDTPESRVAYYRRTCGLDARLKFENQRIYLVVGPIAAVTMPSDLGARVKPLLHDKFGCHGPIIAHPRARRWTFLANPDGTDFADPVLHAELFRAYISLAPVGSEVVLPAPIDLDMVYRVWNTLPPNSFRPWAGTVIDIARQCIPSAADGRHR